MSNLYPTTRLILGAGKHWTKEPNDVFVDIRPFDGIDVVHNLDILPWPFDDNSAIHISAVHVVEHLHINLVQFMDEAWRIIHKGGSLYIETPLAGGDPDLEWADPTHVRCYRPHTFPNYFYPEGIQKFGYTDRPWSQIHLEVKANCIIWHGSPMKP